MITTQPASWGPLPSAVATPEAPSRATDASTNWAALPGGVIDGGEIVILAIKPSMWRPLFDSAPWLVACWGLAAVLTWLSHPIPGLSILLTAQILLLIGLARLGVAVVRWVPTWYVLTNRRILDIQGVRSPRIWSCLLTETRHTSVTETPGERLAGLGTISFVADSSNDRPHQWHAIAKPHEVHAKVRRAIENAIDQHGLGG